MFQFSFIPDLSGISGMLPSIHGDADAAGAGLVGFLDNVLNSITGLLAADAGFQWFPGIAILGLNMHPSLVHFPIAFLSVFFLLEIVGTWWVNEKMRQVASAMLYCGAFGALLAVTAGLYAANTVPHGQDVHEIMEWHERFGLTVAGLAVVLGIWRFLTKHSLSGMEKALFLLLSTIMTVCLIFGADLGGLMVYGHGVAVQTLQQTDANQHHMHGSGDVK